MLHLSGCIISRTVNCSELIFAADYAVISTLSDAYFNRVVLIEEFRNLESSFALSPKCAAEQKHDIICIKRTKYNESHSIPITFILLGGSCVGISIQEEASSRRLLLLRRLQLAVASLRSDTTNLTSRSSIM